MKSGLVPMLLALASPLIGLVSCSPSERAPAVAAEELVSGWNDKAPERVVVIGPATTETLFALGLGNKIVGVSDYCTWPGAADLPRVGGVFNPSLEIIAGLKPDLLIVESKTTALTELGQTQGFSVVSFEIASRAHWERQVIALGKLFHSEQRASDLLHTTKKKLDAINSRRLNNRAGRPKVLIVINRRRHEASGLLVAGGGSFLSELVDIAGGVNVFHDDAKSFIDLNEEVLLQKPPDIILEFNPASDETAMVDDALDIWKKGWPRLPAVRNHAVLTLNGRQHLVPGPRMAETANELARLFRGTQAQVSPSYSR